MPLTFCEAGVCAFLVDVAPRDLDVEEAFFGVAFLAANGASITFSPFGVGRAVHCHAPCALAHD